MHFDGQRRQVLDIGVLRTRVVPGGEPIPQALHQPQRFRQSLLTHQQIKVAENTQTDLRVHMFHQVQPFEHDDLDIPLF